MLSSQQHDDRTDKFCICHVRKRDATLRDMSEDLLARFIENYESMSPQERYDILADDAKEYLQ